MRSYTWSYAAVYKGVVNTSIITSWNTSDQQQWVLLDFCCTAADFKTPDGGSQDLITSLTSAPLHSQHVGCSSLFSGPTPLSLTMWSPLQRHFYKRHCGADKEWEKPESGCRGPVGRVSHTGLSIWRTGFTSRLWPRLLFLLDDALRLNVVLLTQNPSRARPTPASHLEDLCHWTSCWTCW